MEKKIIESHVMKTAIDKWGERSQLEMAQEEATEFALACRKFIRKQNDKNFKNLGSEIADVEIMITQLKMMFPVIGEIVNEQRIFKIERLAKRVYTNDYEADLQNISIIKNKPK